METPAVAFLHDCCRHHDYQLATPLRSSTRRERSKNGELYEPRGRRSGSGREVSPLYRPARGKGELRKCLQETIDEKARCLVDTHALVCYAAIPSVKQSHSPLLWWACILRYECMFGYTCKRSHKLGGTCHFDCTHKGWHNNAKYSIRYICHLWFGRWVS